MLDILKRLPYRESKYRYFIYTCSVFTLLLFYYVAPGVYAAWENLSARTPLGDRIPVSLVLPSLIGTETTSLKAQLPGVPVHQLQPRLHLVGVGERLNKHNDHFVLVLGILPEAQDKVLRVDSSFTLSFQAPSFQLLSEDSLHSKRGQAFQEQLHDSLEIFQTKGEALLPIIMAHLNQYVNLPKPSVLFEDSKLHNAILRALKTEIINKIDLNELVEWCLQSPHLREIGSLVVDHFKLLPIFKRMFQSTIHNLMIEWARTKQMELDYIGRVWVDILRVILGRRPENLISQLKEITMKIAMTGVKEVFRQGSEGLRRNAPKIWHSISALGAETEERFMISAKGSNFFSALLLDERLQHHIKTTYGDDAWGKFMNGFADVIKDPIFSEALKTMKGTMIQLVKNGASVLLLDQEGKGPNPLLLQVLQDLLRGKTSPVVQVIPGKGTPVLPGHVFKVIPYASRSRLTQYTAEIQEN